MWRSVATRVYACSLLRSAGCVSLQPLEQVPRLRSKRSIGKSLEVGFELADGIDRALLLQIQIHQLQRRLRHLRIILKRSPQTLLGQLRMAGVRVHRSLQEMPESRIRLALQSFFDLVCRLLLEKKK